MDRASFTTVAVLVVSLTVAILVPSGTADADDSTAVTHYCYGETATLEYPYEDGATVDWVVDPEPDVEGFESIYRNQSRISITLTGLELVTVTQTLTLGQETDSKTIVIRPMHLMLDESDDDHVYTVRFHNGSDVISETRITNTTTVEAGDRFFDVPDDPVRSGFDFLGWYYEDGNGDTVRFERGDEYSPVTSDIDVYARWTASGTGGSQTVIVNQSHVVTFGTQAGLGCTVLVNDGDSVTFRVDILEGYIFEEGSISATYDRGTLVPVGNIYTLTGVDRDITVEITGLRMFSVDYRLTDGSSVAAEGYSEPPSLIPGGPFGFTVSGSGLRVTVLMGGADITQGCVEGNVVNIDDVTGNLVVIVDDYIAPQNASDDGFPWWILVIVVVILVVVAVAYLRLRDRA